MAKKNVIIVNEYNRIKNLIAMKSSFIKKHLENNLDSKYLLIYKHISYADLPTYAKRSSKDQDLAKELLFYLTTKEMKQIEGFDECIAKQSNIYMPNEFYEFLGIVPLERRKGPQKSAHTAIRINDYANVYLVNDTLEEFKIDKTMKVFELLNKQCLWDVDNLKFNLDTSGLTEIEIRHAIHGIGIKEDIFFHMLRRNIFRNDILMILLEDTFDGKKNMYVMLEKNPKYYTIVGKTNKNWENYLINQMNIEETKLRGEEIILLEKDRTMQNKWRNLLADEISNYTPNDGEVFCAFTKIRCNFENLGTLFRASHIKRFECCDNSEAYDINNGLLLCANADALFDKYYITISEDKKLIFSFLLENDYYLRQQLQLTETIFDMILNDKRMEYIKWHREKFEEKERERRKMAL